MNLCRLLNNHILSQFYLLAVLLLTGSAITAVSILGVDGRRRIANTGRGTGAHTWLRSPDWNALACVAWVGGITAVSLYCVNRIIARVAAPFVAEVRARP